MPYSNPPTLYVGDGADSRRHFRCRAERHLEMTTDRTFTWAYAGRERLWSMALTFRDGKKTSSGLKSQNPRFNFVFAKATEGLRAHNDQFHKQHDGAKRSGIPFGTYHYIDVRESGAEQAKHFLAVISGYEGTLLPAVDVEETHGLSPEHIVACVANSEKPSTRRLGESAPSSTPIGRFGTIQWSGATIFQDTHSGLRSIRNTIDPGCNRLFRKAGKARSFGNFTNSAKVPGISGVADMDQLIGDDISTISR